MRGECRVARESGDHERTVEIGQEIWSNAPDRNGWDAWNLAYALRKLGRSREAAVVLWDAFRVLRADPAAVEAVGGRLASEFGWSAYDSALKNGASQSPAQAAKAATAVVQIWEEFTGDAPWTTQFCPVPLVVNRAMKLLKEAQAWSLLADLAATTSGDRMPDESMRPDQAGASQGGDWTRAEAWYTSSARAFVEAGRFGDALTLVQGATDREVPLGRHCLRWVYFYGAKAAIGAEDGVRALDMVALAHANGVTDWWMGVFEATAADLAGDRPAAIEALANTFVKADRRNVSPEFLCSALDAASRLLADDYPELAGHCARVHHGIRERQQWRIPESLVAASGGVSEPESAIAAIVASFQELSRSAQTRAAGTITRLISEGSGFLRDDGGVDRYFSFSRGVPMPSWCFVGQRVTFNPVQRLDRKVGVEKPAAEDLESISELLT